MTQKQRDIARAMHRALSEFGYARETVRGSTMIGIGESFLRQMAEMEAERSKRQHATLSLDTGE